MANILISTMPALGHVNPLLLTATRLVQRGHQVWWHSGSEVKLKIEATGAKYILMHYTPNIVEKVVEAQQENGLAAANAAITNLFVEPMLGQLKDYQLILRDFPADVLVVDMCSLGAALLHEQGGPVWASVGINPLRTEYSPVYGSGKMPALSPITRFNNRMMNWLGNHLFLRPVNKNFIEKRQSIGLPLPPTNKLIFDYLMSPFLHLQGTTPAFEFPYPKLSPQIHFLGPMLSPMPANFQPPWWWEELKIDRPVVHITQGSVATDVKELICPTIEALAGEDILVVATTPNLSQLKNLPPNVRVETMIPHSALLPFTDVMVTNGGYNGVKMALAHGVPLVVAGASEDKPEVNSRVEWTGVGVNLRTGLPTPAQLKQAIQRVLKEPSFQNKAQVIGEDFETHDSPLEVAQLLEKLASTKSPVYRTYK